MSFSIFRCYELQCAHRLTMVPPTHKCATLHGHAFFVEIHVEAVESGSERSARLQGLVVGGLDEQGMVCDYDLIDRAWAPTFKRLDHKTLNDFIDNPTSEVIARYICKEVERELTRICNDDGRRALHITHVIVRENARSGAVYRND